MRKVLLFIALFCGGIINMAPGKELLAPKGAIVNIEEGEIN